MAVIDLLFAGDRFMVYEASSSPGLEGIESRCDVGVAAEAYDFLRIRAGLLEVDEAS